VDRELAGIRVYGRRLAEFVEVETLDDGRMTISSRLLSTFEDYRLSRVTKATGCFARAHVSIASAVSVPFSLRLGHSKELEER